MSRLNNPAIAPSIQENDDLTAGAGTGIDPEDTGSGEGEKITEPFDPTLIRVTTKFMTIDLLLSRINDKAIDLTPDFQRNVVWKKAAQSRLIESILIKIPLPAFYMDGTNEDKWLVVDGLQRLNSLQKFVLTKQLRLTDLEFLRDYEGKAYSDLPPPFQRRIKEAQVTVYLIEPGTPPNVKFNIFKRINTGGLPLSSQEIRHALNQGQVVQFLAELANSKEFRSATDYSIRDTRMGDRETVLRFLAFTITPYTEYRSDDLDAFLNVKMAELNQMPNEQLNRLRKRFHRSMKAARAIFGNDAFRKRYTDKGRRLFVNKALFETWSVNLDKLTDEELTKLQHRKKELRNRFIELMNNREFDSAVSQGTGSIKKVRLRFSSIENIIKEVLSR